MTKNYLYYPEESPKRCRLEITSINQALLDHLAELPTRSIEIKGRNGFVLMVCLSGNTSMDFSMSGINFYIDESITAQNFNGAGYNVENDYDQETSDELEARVDSVIEKIPNALVPA